MKSPIILEGDPFPWDAPNPLGAIIDAAGKVNWMAAAFADPGVMSCPKCKEYLWNEGNRVRCPDCGHEFETPNGQWQRERQEKST